MFIDDGHNLDVPPVGGGVELKVHGPYHVGCCGRVDGRGAGPGAFTSTALRHAQAFVSPQALKFLVVDVPAVGTGIVIRPPVSPPRMRLGVVTQPLAQASIRVCWGLVGWLVALGGAVVPGHPARERPRVDVPGLEVSPGDLLQRCLLKFGISEQPFERGVLPLEFLEPFASSAFKPPNWLRHR